MLCNVIHTQGEQHRANLFSKLAITKKTRHLNTNIQETLQASTIDTKKVMAGKEEEPDYMTSYKNFLIQGVLLPDEDEPRHLKWKASYYVILDGKLFKRGLTTPLLKCLNNQQANYVIRELHEVIYGLYTRGRSLATKVVRASYYWPTLRANTLDFTKRCRQCQEFVDVTRTPHDNLYSLSSPCHFAMRGMDILGLLPKALGAVKYLLVVIEMNWGKDVTRNLSQQGRKIHLETLHMKIWPPLRHCHRQWYSI